MYQLIVLLSGAKVAYASIDTFIAKANTAIVNPLIVLLFALAVAYFLYGVLEFILNPESEDKRTTGKSHMIWGIVGITVMLSVWTILGIVLRTFHITGVTLTQDSQNNTGSININLK